MTGRERVLAMMAGRAVDRVPLMPITMMFAADFAGVKYGAYAADHRVLAEAQLRTAAAFGFDYVSCISDPAREAADCGAAVAFFPDQPPAIDESRALLAEKARLADLTHPDPIHGRMGDRVRAAALFRERVAGRYLIEGWVEGPCAEAADLRGINALMLDFYEDPAFVADLFAFVLELGIRFAKAQIEAGCDIIGIGDAAASLVGPAIYESSVWPFEKRLVDAIHAMGAGVRLHICGDTRPQLEAIGRLGCGIVDLDYPVSVAEARAAMGPGQVLLGNLDPVAAVRSGTPESIAGAVARCHLDAGAKYIAGAGCEIVRDTPRENLEALCAYAHKHSA